MFLSLSWILFTAFIPLVMLLYVCSSKSLFLISCVFYEDIWKKNCELSTITDLVCKNMFLYPMWTFLSLLYLIFDPSQCSHDLIPSHDIDSSFAFPNGY